MSFVVIASHIFFLISDHPQCEFIDSLLGLNFPSDEYNTIYYPRLLPTIEFSHRFIFKEDSNKDSHEIHCLWRDDSRNWILGLCKNIDNNIGDYYLDTGSECPDVSNGWKDVKNDEIINGIMKDIKDRISVGRRVAKSSTAGIFGASGSKKRERIRQCLEWKKVIYRNQYECLKFFPPLDKKNRSPTLKACKLKIFPLILKT